MEAKTKQE